MNPPLNARAFWEVYGTVLLSFMTSRLLLQTDLLMVAGLGPEATAAFGVPGRLMVIDAVAVYALAPVVSIAVSREEEKRKRHAILASSLGLTFALAILLSSIGMWLYPRVVDALVADSGTRLLAREAVFWMTLSIPVRMLACIATMGLFACGQGGRMMVIYLVTLSANAGLDWMLIYRFGLGFKGAYLATFIVSSIELLWLMVLVQGLAGRFPISSFTLDWFRKTVGNVGAEFLRLTSWQVEGFALLFIVAAREAWMPIFSAVGVISEFSNLLMVPLIALMRTSAMLVARHAGKSAPPTGWHLLKPIRGLARAVALVLGLGLAAGATGLGSFAYHLHGERLRWWCAFAMVYGLGLPLLVHGSLLRACYQAHERFGRIAWAEIPITWILFMPSLWLALRHDNPWAFYLAFLAREVLILGWLHLGLPRVAPRTLPDPILIRRSPAPCPPARAAPARGSGARAAPGRPPRPGTGCAPGCRPPGCPGRWPCRAPGASTARRSQVPKVRKPGNKATMAPVPPWRLAEGVKRLMCKGLNTKVLNDFERNHNNSKTILNVQLLQYIV